MDFLQDAAKREVLEETGLEFEPTTLISVEMGCGTWFRFNFTGKVTGNIFLMCGINKMDTV